MKKIKMRYASLAAVLMIFMMVAAVLAPSLAANAEEFTYNDEYLRITDFPDVIEKEAQSALNRKFLAKVIQYKTDFPVAIRKTAKPENEDAGAYAQQYYKHNDFGYGADRSGLMLVYYQDGKSCFVKSFGAATAIYDQEACDSLAKLVETEHEKSSGDYETVLASYLEEAVKFIGLPAHEDPYYTELTAAGKPNWYPDPVVNPFPDYHNQGSPRVVDVANIFTDEEEAAMVEKIEKVRKTYDQDLIVFTDVDTYGLSRGVYAADFYQFGGYGFGDDYHGSVLFICMKEGNRGWWTAARGNEKDHWFSETNINLIDDQLESYMKAGQYGEGVLDYLDHIYALYGKPEWMPEDPAGVERFHDADASRIADHADLLSEEKEEELAAGIAELSEKYNTDIVLLTENTPFATLSAYEIGQTFFDTQGYGAGETYDGACFVIRPVGDSGKVNWSLYFSGDRSCYQEETKDLIYEWAEEALNQKDYDAACTTVVEKLGQMYEKGKVRPMLHMTWPGIIGIILGLILSAAFKAFLQKGMKTVKKAAEASHYLVPGSFVLTRKKDKFRTSSVTRVYDPPSSGDSGGSSSGSSYSSGYSSSGGGSFTGGGRSF